MALFPDYTKINDINKTSDIEPHHILVAGAGLEVMREIKEKVERIELKLCDLERKIHEHIPEKVLTENKFVQEIQGSEDIVEKIVAEIKKLNTETAPVKKEENRYNGNNENLTIVERKKIEKITNLLQTNGKLSSLQLAHLMDLSRTRANEYLKQMEGMDLVEGILIGKEKYYQLIDRIEVF